MADDAVVAQLARNFARTRAAQRLAREVLVEYRQTHGNCAADHRRVIDDGPISCFQAAIPRDEWCEVCLGSQPLWERRRQTAKEAGAAMQRLLRACRA